VKRRSGTVCEGARIEGRHAWSTTWTASLDLQCNHSPLTQSLRRDPSVLVSPLTRMKRRTSSERTGKA